ncbi:hypothetical protein J6590_077179 [Homalodisca vitripennis]|nr:hypothetical protein J6590_077179 [Homalodisca vitripennis]
MDKLEMSLDNIIKQSEEFKNVARRGRGREGIRQGGAIQSLDDIIKQSEEFKNVSRRGRGREGQGVAIQSNASGGGGPMRSKQQSILDYGSTNIVNRK